VPTIWGKAQNLLHWIPWEECLSLKVCEKPGVILEINQLAIGWPKIINTLLMRERVKLPGWPGITMEIDG
jgi:hypothetical protein